MKTTSHFHKAFSLVGWMFVLGLCAFLFVLLIPATTCGGPSSKAAARRVACLNNLRQIGIGFQMFAEDHEGKFPMKLANAQGGSLEFNNSAAMTYRHFQVLSNYVGSPRVFACPSDQRTVTNVALMKNENLSLFLGLNATLTNRSSLLSGDRNLSTNDAALKTGIYTLNTNSNAGWTKAMHKKSGNILRSDASAQFLSSQKLVNQLKSSGTNHLISLP